jgi:hypothetical protein
MTEFAENHPILAAAFAVAAAGAGALGVVAACIGGVQVAGWTAGGLALGIAGAAVVVPGTVWVMNQVLN